MLFVAAVIAYVFYRWNERRRFIEQVKGDRITPDELKHKLEAGEPVTIIDLRHPLDRLTDPQDLASCSADFARGTGGAARRDRSRWRDRAVLHLTQRSDQRPGGAAITQARHSSRASAAGWILRVEAPWVPAHRADAEER